MQLFCTKKYFFVRKCKIHALRDRFFFDLSNHKIVGGCSTLLAKSNKKMHFSRLRFSFISAQRHKKGSLRSEPEWVTGYGVMP